MLNATKILKIQLQVNVPGLRPDLLVNAPVMRSGVDYVSRRPSSRPRAQY